MGFTSLEEAESALEQISNEIYVQLKDCKPYQATEDDYRMLKADPHGDLMAEGAQQGLKRYAAMALANRHGFTDENLMVIARDYIIESRSLAEDYCKRLQGIVEEETDKEFEGLAGAVKRLRSKKDQIIKAAADASIQQRVDKKKALLHAKFDDELGELHREALAFLREVYGKDC